MSKSPRYTDSARWPNGYRRAVETDIGKTFARVRAEQKKAAEQAASDEAERIAKLRPMRKAQ
jgi:hypothetical protein